MRRRRERCAAASTRGLCDRCGCLAASAGGDWWGTERATRRRVSGCDLFPPPLLSPPAPTPRRESAPAPVVSLACHAPPDCCLVACRRTGVRVAWAAVVGSAIEQHATPGLVSTHAWHEIERARACWVSQLSPTLRRLNTGQQQYDTKRKKDNSTPLSNCLMVLFYECVACCAAFPHFVRSFIQSVSSDPILPLCI